MRYIPALDGVRAAAVMFVLVFHSRAPWLTGGYMGVDVFFVLSGFLITSLLLAEFGCAGSINLGRFYLHRFARLTPPLIVMVAAYLLLAPFLWPGYASHGRDAVAALLYLSDYGHAFWDLPRMLRHTWSLAVEEHFYLLWPMLMGVLSNARSRPALVLVLALLYALATAWRIYCLETGQDWAAVYPRFDTRLSGLVLGALVAAALPLHPTIRVPRIIVAAVIATAAALVGAARWRDVQMLQLGITIIEIATALVIVMIMQGSRLTAWLGSRPLAYLGRLSYGIYLFHYPAMVYLRQDSGWEVALIGGTAFAFGAAALSYHTVEAAVRRWRAQHHITSDTP